MCVPASLLRHDALAYLGYSDSDLDDKTQEILHTALAHIAEWSDYKQHYCYLKDLPEMPAFLQQASYKSLQGKLDTALLFAASLGLGIDQRIRTLSLNRLSEAVVVNAVANAYLEARTELFVKKILPGAVLFCPGYAGTEPGDNRYILDLLDAQKHLGIYLKESGLMLPEKSMAGIVVANYRFSCKSCIIRSKCPYLKQGKTCYGSKPGLD
ncbi:MAG: vitamin B12 dependent-methionine synthase activation domain-containing protein [Bacteroidales bacterium]|nr:vitamin B12 dependent-methionine synthase activation domain-containing protein [Bacteroidales bacterium]